MAAGVVMVAMDVAMARGRLMLSLRLMLLSSMEAITAMLLPSLMLPTLTPMAMLLPTPSVATPTFGRGRLRLSLAMAAGAVMVAMDVVDTATARGRPSLAMAMAAGVVMAATDVAMARGRLSPVMVMAAGVVMEATDVAMARGLLMLSLRPTLPSYMEATTATPPPSHMLPTLMLPPTLTPMAMLLLTSDQNLVVFFNVIQATIIRDESGDLFTILDQLHSDALSNGRIWLFSFNANFFKDDTLSMGSASKWVSLEGSTKISLLVS